MGIKIFQKNAKNVLTKGPVWVYNLNAGWLTLLAHVSHPRTCDICQTLSRQHMSQASNMQLVSQVTATLTYDTS